MLTLELLIVKIVIHHRQAWNWKYSQMSHNRKPLYFHLFPTKLAAYPYSKAVHQPTFIIAHFCLQVERKELRRNTYEILNKYISLIMPWNYVEGARITKDENVSASSAFISKHMLFVPIACIITERPKRRNEWTLIALVENSHHAKTISLPLTSAWC